MKPTETIVKRELSFTTVEFPEEFFDEQLKNDTLSALSEIPFEKISIILSIPRNVIGAGDTEDDTRLLTCGFIKSYKTASNVINFKILDDRTNKALAGAGRYICIVPLISTVNGKFKRILKLILCTKAFIKHSGYSFVVNKEIEIKEDSAETSKPKHVEKHSKTENIKENDEVVWDTSVNKSEVDETPEVIQVEEPVIANDGIVVETTSC